MRLSRDAFEPGVLERVVDALIDDTPDRPIRILRRPDADDLALTGQQSHQPYTNSASVIRYLESRVGAAATA